MLMFTPNDIVCEFVHCSWFFFGFTWLSEFMGPFLEIDLVNLMRVFE